MLKILQARLQHFMIHELPDFQDGFRKGRGTRDEIANICWIIEKAREFQKKTSILLHWLCQSVWLYRSQQIVENSSREEYQTILPASWEICMQVKKQQLEQDIEQTGYWEKSTSCKIPGWITHKLESRLPGEIPASSNIQMIPL